MNIPTGNDFEKAVRAASPEDRFGVAVGYLTAFYQFMPQASLEPFKGDDLQMAIGYAAMLALKEMGLLSPEAVRELVAFEARVGELA